MATTLAAAVVILRIWFHGEALADRVERELNERIRGKVEVGSVEWSVGDLPGLIFGGWLPVEISDVVVYDIAGTPILQAPRVTAEINGYDGAFGRHDLIVRDLVVEPGGRARIEQVREPNPAHELDVWVVSLVLAFRPPAPPSFSSGISAHTSPVISLQNYQVKDADLEFAFPAFSAVAHHVSGEGILRFDGRDPLSPRLVFKLAPKAAGGTLTIGPLSFDLSNLDVANLSLVPQTWPSDDVPHDLAYKATADGEGGAKIALDGRIRDFWTGFLGGEHALDLDVANAGAMVNRLSAGIGGGTAATVHLDVDGPAIGPRVAVRLENAETSFQLGQGAPLALHVPRASVAFDLVTDTGTVEDTIAQGAGGELQLSAAFNMRPFTFDASVDVTRPLDASGQLPPRVVELAGGAVSGRVRAVGNGEVQRFDPIDLRIGRGRLTGALGLSRGGLIEADGLTASLDGTTAREINGRIDIENRQLDLAFGVTSRDVARWLRVVRAPELARSISGKGQIRGTFDDLSGRGTLSAGGVPVFSRMDADLSYRRGSITIHEAQSSAFDGWVRGSGVIDLGPSPRLRRFEAQGVKLDVSKLPGVGPAVDGRADIRLSADGPVRDLRVDAKAALTELHFGGERYRDTTVEFRAETGAGKSLNAHLERVAGGKLDVAATLDRRGQLGGAISLRDLPLESLSELSGMPSRTAGGDVEAEIQLSGTLKSPTADGYLSLVRAYFRNTFIGNADIQFERAGDGLIKVAGTILQGRVRVDGTIATRPPFVTDLALRLRRAEIDEVAPEIAAQVGARGWVTGEVRLRGPLLLAPGERPSIEARLTEAVVVVDYEDVNGRPSPIRLRNKSPLAMTFDGERLTLLEDAVIAGPTGDVVVSGSGNFVSAAPDALDFKLHGRVSVALLEPYFRQIVEGLDGAVAVKVAVGGSWKHKQWSGEVEIDNIAAKPIGQDAIVTIPKGRILFDKDQVGITGIDIEVIDEFSDEQARLSVAGGVKLVNLRPAQWAIRIDGDLAGKMLLLAAPQLFSTASGKASISVALLGAGEVPSIDGTIELGPETRDKQASALTFTPRGLRRDIALTGGTIRFTGDLVELDRVSGSVDDEGDIVNLSGDISLVNWRPESVDLSLSARGLPFRVPQTLEMSVNVDRLDVVGGRNGLELRGSAEIVDGRYIRKWRPLLDALKQVRTTETSTPFYEAIPLLANADLDINFDVRSFFVRNNMASIDLSGAVQVTGTPAQPRLEGIVRVEQGSFKFQGIRAKFSRTSGTVAFSRFRKFPEDTPYLDIRSESDYRDITGQDHLVLLTLAGPIGSLNWDLSTAAGLNKAQTFTLIFSGRTPDEVRKDLLGDEAIGSRPGQLDGTRSTASTDNSIYAATDELVKDLAGDFFSLLIEDPIKEITTLDVARLEIGSQLSVGFHGEKNLTESLRILGDAERSLRGLSVDLQGRYRVSDNWSFDAEVLHKQFDDEAEEDETKGSVKLIWRKVILP